MNLRQPLKLAAYIFSISHHSASLICLPLSNISAEHSIRYIDSQILLSISCFARLRISWKLKFNYDLGFAVQNLKSPNFQIFG